MGGVIALAAVLLGGLFATRTWPFGSGLTEETAELVSSDGTRVTVRARVISGSLRIIAAPEALPSSTWKALSPPVRIEAQGLEGTFHLTFEPAGTARSKPVGDIEVLCVSQTAGTTPLGSQQLPDGSITAAASCTTVTLGEVKKDAVQQQVTNPLDQPTDARDPLAVALLQGTRNGAACRTDQILIGAKVGTDTEPLCVEYLADQGSYRLAYDNWDGAPYVFTLRDGATRSANMGTPGTEPATPSADNPLVAYLVGSRGANAALVARNGGLEATYRPEAATPGAEIVGHPDSAAWVLYGLRENLLGTAGVNANKKRPTQAVTLVDQAIASGPVTRCATKAAATLGDSSTIQQTVATVRSGYATCLPMAVTALGATYAQFNGGDAARIGKRITAVMTPADKQSTRAVVSFQKLLLGAGDETKPADTVTRKLSMPRFMTKDEVFARAPTSPRGYFDASRCPAPPPGDALRPMGVPPNAECLYLMDVDLDGNRKPDRLLTWTSGRPGGTGSDSGSQGAFAYLDDGRFAALPGDEAGSNWLEDFEAVRGAYLANDNKEQMLVEYEDRGANTLWFTVMGLGSDGQLHLARTESGEAFPLAVGGGASHSSSYGCYSRDGRGRIATWTWAISGPVGNVTPGELKVAPYELDNLVAKRVGDDLNYVTPQYVAPGDQAVGSECSQPDPGKRGSYTVHVNGALSRADRDTKVQAAAQRGLNAITTGDVRAIRTAFAPQAQAQAIAMAQTVAGMSPLRRGMTCNWQSLTNNLGLPEEASCNATFDVEVARLDVSVGRDAKGNFRAVGTDFTSD